MIDDGTQGEYSIKKLVEVDGRFILRPLNSDYDDIWLDPTRGYRLVGVLRSDWKIGGSGEL